MEYIILFAIVYFFIGYFITKNEIKTSHELGLMVPLYIILISFLFWPLWLFVNTEF